MDNRQNHRVYFLLLVLLVAPLLTGIWLPLYSDEVVTKFSVARFFLEHGTMVSFFPQCASSLGQTVSWLFYPAAVVISWVYGGLGPLGLRLASVLSALVWFGLLACWCHRQDKTGWLRHFSFLAGCSLLGVMPYLWVLSRPEQFMLLPLLVVGMLATSQSTVKRSLAEHAGRVGGVIVLASVFFYAHPKSVFFSPFFVIAAWAISRPLHWLIRVGLVAYVVALAFQVLKDASQLGACTEAPAVQALLSANSLMPGMILKDPMGFAMSALHNLISFPGRLMQHLVFSPDYQSGWLPPMSADLPGLKWLNSLIWTVTLAFVLGSHVLAIVLAVRGIVKRSLCVPVMLALLLASADVLNVMLYNIQNFYAGIQYIPVSLLISVLLLKPLAPLANERFSKWLGYVPAFVCGLAALSVAVLLYTMLPALQRNASNPVATIPGQPLSVPVFGVSAQLESIRDLAQSCHIPLQGSKNVVVDHMTYFALAADRNPIHVLYISELGYGGDLLGGKLVPFLKSLDSPGVISRCEWMPAELRGSMKRNDLGYCCSSLVE